MDYSILLKELNRDQKQASLGVISIMPLWYLLINILGPEFMSKYSIEIPIIASYCLSMASFFIVYLSLLFIFMTIEKRHKNVLSIPDSGILTLTIFNSWITILLFLAFEFQSDIKLLDFIENYFKMLISVYILLLVILKVFPFKKKDNIGSKKNYDT